MPPRKRKDAPTSSPGAKKKCTAAKASAQQAKAKQKSSAKPNASKQAEPQQHKQDPEAKKRKLSGKQSTLHFLAAQEGADKTPLTESEVMDKEEKEFWTSLFEPQHQHADQGIASAPIGQEAKSDKHDEPSTEADKQIDNAFKPASTNGEGPSEPQQDQPPVAEACDTALSPASTDGQEAQAKANGATFAAEPPAVPPAVAEPQAAAPADTDKAKQDEQCQPANREVAEPCTTVLNPASTDGQEAQAKANGATFAAEPPAVPPAVAEPQAAAPADTDKAKQDEQCQPANREVAEPCTTVLNPASTDGQEAQAKANGATFAAEPPAVPPAVAEPQAAAPAEIDEAKQDEQSQPANKEVSEPCTTVLNPASTDGQEAQAKANGATFAAEPPAVPPAVAEPQAAAPADTDKAKQDEQSQPANREVAEPCTTVLNPASTDGQEAQAKANGATFAAEPPAVPPAVAEPQAAAPAEIDEAKQDEQSQPANKEVSEPCTTAMNPASTNGQEAQAKANGATFAAEPPAAAAEIDEAKQDEQGQPANREVAEPCTTVLNPASTDGQEAQATAVAEAQAAAQGKMEQGQAADTEVAEAHTIALNPASTDGHEAQATSVADAQAVEQGQAANTEVAEAHTTALNPASTDGQEAQTKANGATFAAEPPAVPPAVAEPQAAAPAEIDEAKQDEQSQPANREVAEPCTTVLNPASTDGQEAQAKANGATAAAELQHEQSAVAEQRTDQTNQPTSATVSQEAQAEPDVAIPAQTQPEQPAEFQSELDSDVDSEQPMSFLVTFGQRFDAS